MAHPHGGGSHADDASVCSHSEHWSGSCSSSYSRSRSRGRTRGKDKHKGSKGRRGRDTRKGSSRKTHKKQDKDRSAKKHRTKDRDRENRDKDSGDDDDAEFPGTTYRFLGGKELPGTTNERAKQAYPRRHKYAILMRMANELIGNLRHFPSIN